MVMQFSNGSFLALICFIGSSSICRPLNSVERYCGTVLADNQVATADIPICGKVLLIVACILFTSSPRLVRPRSNAILNIDMRKFA